MYDKIHYKLKKKKIKKIIIKIKINRVSEGGAVVKNLPANARDSRDAGSIPGSGRSSGEGNGNALQYLAWEAP